jgi:glycine dehydrogenase subunit 1
VLNDSFFNEFTLLLPVAARPVVHKLAEMDILGGVSLGRLYPDNDGLANGLVVAVTETVTEEDIAAFAAALKEVLA